jgi:AraC-like DNA-binding protein/mannose-6-phosphate isomerase-like protein (cupin superfamily)
MGDFPGTEMPLLKRNRPAAVHFPDYGIHVAESRHGDDFRMEPTVHPFPKILYIWGGSGTLFAADHQHRLRAGRLALIPARIPHHLADDRRTPLSLYVLCIRRDWVERFEESNFGHCRIIGQTSLCAMAQRLFRDLLYEQTSGHPGASLRITGRVLEWLGILSRWQEEHGSAIHETISVPLLLSHARVRAATAEVARSFYRPHTLESTAAQAGLGPRRFSQLFREITGESWPSFLREKRIDHARHLLLETDRSVVAVAFECGFDDLSSFYRAFHRSTGDSPESWRKSSRRRADSTLSRALQPDKQQQLTKRHHAPF